MNNHNNQKTLAEIYAEKFQEEQKLRPEEINKIKNKMMQTLEQLIHRNKGKLNYAKYNHILDVLAKNKSYSQILDTIGIFNSVEPCSPINHEVKTKITALYLFLLEEELSNYNNTVAPFWINCKTKFKNFL